MKSFEKVILLVILFILSFILQVYFFNGVTFFGVRANLILLFVISLSLWLKPNISVPFVVLAGLSSDILFSYTIGKNLIIYLIIMMEIMALSKLYNKQNFGVIIVMTLIATATFEYALWLFNAIEYNLAQNVFQVLAVVLKGSIINTLIQLINIKIYKKMADE